MSKRARSIALGAAIAIATAGASVAVGANCEAATTDARVGVNVAAARSRPFSATVESWTTVEPTPDTCVLLNKGAGTGIGVHMGAIAWVAWGPLNVCTGGTDAEFVMTAANGDEVFGKYESLVRPDFDAGVFTFAGRWEIVGGTGRFGYATGEGTLSGWGNLVQPPEPSKVMATMVGNISY